MTKKQENKTEKTSESDEKSSDKKLKEKEIGGYEDQNLPEPTRYGDWEVAGRCSDF